MWDWSPETKVTTTKIDVSQNVWEIATYKQMFNLWNSWIIITSMRSS